MSKYRISTALNYPEMLKTNNVYFKVERYVDGSSHKFWEILSTFNELSEAKRYITRLLEYNKFKSTVVEEF